SLASQRRSQLCQWRGLAYRRRTRDRNLVGVSVNQPILYIVRKAYCVRCTFYAVHIFRFNALLVSELTSIFCYNTRWGMTMSKNKKNTKERALEYKDHRQAKETEQASEQKRPPLRNDQDFIDLVGRRIEEAMRQCAFDNLRGHGKPLNLQRNPFVPAD